MHKYYFKSSVFSCVHSFTLSLKSKLSNINCNCRGIRATISADTAEDRRMYLCFSWASALLVQIKLAKYRFKLLYMCVCVCPAVNDPGSNGRAGVLWIQRCMQNMPKISEARLCGILQICITTWTPTGNSCSVRIIGRICSLPWTALEE